MKAKVTLETSLRFSRPAKYYITDKIFFTDDAGRTPDLLFI
jgi:hypothetical protein